jgi:uncharacterized protein (UPF0335 family)
MARNQAKNYNVAELQPDELNELKRLVREYVRRLENIDNEIELLKEDKKQLKDEFEQHLDLRTLNIVLRVLKAEQGVLHQATYETFYETLTDSDASDSEETEEV